MLTKQITYIDYNGEERTETFYFNISKAELTKLELQYPGTYSAHLQRIIDAKDVSEIMQTYSDLIDLSYGVKSDDGKRFIKSEELTEAFKQTEAYTNLFMSLLQDEKEAAAFASGILPDIGQKQGDKDELMAKTKALIENKKA